MAIRPTRLELELELADTPRIREIIGIFRPSEIKAWAYDPAHPDEHWKVEVVTNGRSVATTQANLFRQDLRATGYGRGYHAFELVLQEKLPTDQPDAEGLGSLNLRPSRPATASPAAAMIT